MVGVAAERIQQVLLAGGLVMRHGALDQVPGAVHLMQVAQVLPAQLRLDMGEVRVQVAVWLLGADDLIRHVIHFRFQFGVGVGGQRIAGRLQPLTRVGITEDQHDWRRHLAFEVQVEGADPSTLFQLAEDVRNGGLAVGFDTRRPEGVGEVHLRKRNGG